MEVKELGDPRVMARLLFAVCFAVGVYANVTGTLVLAQHPSYYQLLPETTQAAVWVRDAKDLGDRWDKTLLSQMTRDPAVKPFFSEQQDSIEKKLMEAGWRLGVKPKDLAQYLEGQLALAWMEKSETRKPYAVALLADVSDNPATVDKMLGQVDEALSKNQVGKKQLSHQNQQIIQYILPKRPGQLLEDSSYVTAFAGKFLVTDDLQLLHDLIDKISGRSVATKSLSEDVDFIESRKQLKITGTATVEYFARPIGIAKVVRDIGGKRSRSGVDLLAVLKNQGFDAIKCISGEVWFAEGDADLSHRGFVLAQQPLPRAAAVLNFPNRSLTELPAFVSPEATGYLATHWSSQEAFWNLEPLVDELAGTQGTFNEMLNGFKNDPFGPQVDVRAELLPLLANDLVAVTDNQPGEIKLDSRRNLIALRVKDAEKASKLLERWMRTEAKAERSSHAEIEIYEFSNEPVEVNEELFNDFVTEEDNRESDDEALLNQWSICVFDGWVLFSSHVEMLREAIDLAQGNKKNLSQQPDFASVKDAILQLSNEDPCAWKITRNQLALRVQYELFRQGKLSESESMVATILNKIVDNTNELKNKQSPTINGQSLPDYEKVAKYLRPSGFKVNATPSGWAFGGLWVGREPNLSGKYQVDTARFGVTETKSQR